MILRVGQLSMTVEIDEICTQALKNFKLKPFLQRKWFLFLKSAPD